MKCKPTMWALSLMTAFYLSGSSLLAQSVQTTQAAEPSAKITSTVTPSDEPAEVISTKDLQRFEAIREKFETGFQGVKVDGVTSTPFQGLFEIRIANDVLYVNEEVSFVLQGALVDVATRTDLTAQRLEAINRVDFSSLPLDKAIPYVKGDGSRQIAVFEDPNCIYCKRLHESLSEIDNVTVYSLMFPILSPDSLVKAESIWCAENPSQAWQDWMLAGIEPTPMTCENPIEQTLQFGMSLGIEGTPAIIFSDGTRVGGWLPAEQLELKLDSIQP